MPPASAVSNSTNNAAVQAAKAEREQKLRGALKIFIQHERQRKQEEYEAKCEELRLKHEQEEREREYEATLRETREEIAQLDDKLKDLHNQKQHLFLQLKKVLNDDENRRKQQKDNELLAMQQALQIQASAQVFMPPVRLQHQAIGNQPMKRGRSPSPPQALYKASATFGPTKHDDVRAADLTRFWNKPNNQYQSPGTLFYQATGAGPPSVTQTPNDARIQPLYPYSLQLRPGYHLEFQPSTSVPVSKSDNQSGKQPTQVFHINLDQPTISQAEVVGLPLNANSSMSTTTKQQPQVTMEKLNERYHIEVKQDAPPPSHVLSIPHIPEGVIYKPIVGDLTPNILQIATNLAQNPKASGSITQGYAPGRGATHEQQLARQQLTVLPGQPGQPATQNQLHYTRRLF